MVGQVTVVPGAGDGGVRGQAAADAVSPAGYGGRGQPSERGKDTSTRRFFFRPASVELSAIGYCSP